jgi:hypothetical protein
MHPVEIYHPHNINLYLSNSRSNIFAAIGMLAPPLLSPKLGNLSMERRADVITTSLTLSFGHWR